MDKIDALLQKRLNYVKNLANIQADEPDSEMLIKALKRAINEIDRELKRESADKVALEDIKAAEHAIDKAQYHQDWDRAKLEVNFFQTRSTYRFLLRSSGKEDAEQFLLEQTRKLGKVYIEHLRNGTIPEEFK